MFCCGRRRHASPFFFSCQFFGLFVAILKFLIIFILTRFYVNNTNFIDFSTNARKSDPSFVVSCHNGHVKISKKSYISPGNLKPANIMGVWSVPIFTQKSDDWCSDKRSRIIAQYVHTVFRHSRSLFTDFRSQFFWQRVFCSIPRSHRC